MASVVCFAENAWMRRIEVKQLEYKWVVPRDSWLVNRITTQPGAEFFKEAIGSQADQMLAFAEATSTADLFLRLEACGALLRITATTCPRCSTWPR